MIPPISCLRAVRGFMIWPAAKAPTARRADFAGQRMHAHLVDMRAEREGELLAFRAAG